MMRRRRGGGGAAAAAGCGVVAKKNRRGYPQRPQIKNHDASTLMKGLRYLALIQCYVCAYGHRFSHFACGYHCIQLNGGNKILIVRGVNVVKRSAHGG